MKKLAIITTHPIQYNAPIFKLLSERKNIAVKVFYTWENSKDGIFDKKFGKEIKWDIPLLDGYNYMFVKNISKDQGTHHFNGIINPDLNKQIELWGAKAILVFGWSFRSHFKAMRYFKDKIPVYFRGDSHLLDEVPGLKTVIRRITLKFVYRFVDLAFYVGINNKNYYLKHGLTEKQLLHAPHAVDNERFDDKTGLLLNEAVSWRKELNIGKEDIVFLFAGKFEYIKDPILLIKAAISIENPNLKFVFAGNGKLESEMKNLAKNSNNIIFIPFQNQSKMPVLYRLCDVFVLPSRTETWGLAINEAMACGKPVLVSNKAGCVADLIKNGENAFTFETGNLADLIMKINSFNLSNISRFSLRSKEIIRQNSFENIVSTIEKALN